MKRVLAGLLGLGICLSPFKAVASGVEIDLRPLSVGSQGRELLAQGIDSRKAEADRLFLQGIKQFKTSQFEAAWPINDGSTAFLMANFYQNLQQNPNKAQALRQAMLVTMKKYPDPESWAAFTLMGEAE